jgi:hypothetical protein
MKDDRTKKAVKELSVLLLGDPPLSFYPIAHDL